MGLKLRLSHDPDAMMVRICKKMHIYNNINPCTFSKKIGHMFSLGEGEQDPHGVVFIV